MQSPFSLLCLIMPVLGENLANFAGGLGMPTELEKKKSEKQQLHCSVTSELGIMPTQQCAVTCQGYPEIKPRDISEKAVPGRLSPTHKQGEIYALPRSCGGDRLSGCQSLFGLVLASAWSWWEGALCPASCAHTAVLLDFAPLLRTCVSGIRGFISWWKLFQVFKEKSMVWGPTG